MGAAVDGAVVVAGEQQLVAVVRRHVLSLSLRLRLARTLHPVAWGKRAAVASHWEIYF